MQAAPKKVVGRPFQKGQSGNPSGRPRDPLLAALKGKMTPEKASAIADTLLEKAEAGDMQAVGMVWERLAGKVPNRNENGDPGDFDLDFSDWSLADLQQAAAKLRRVK